MKKLKKRILVTTDHPAPYMDDLFERMSDKFFLEVVYMASISKEKSWTSFRAQFPGRVAREISTLTLVKMIRSSDLIIIGGWANFFNIKLILISLILNSKTAIFSDAPNVDTKSHIVRNVQSLMLRLIPFYFVAGREAGRIFAETYSVKDRERIKEFPYQSWLPDPALVNRHKELRKQALASDGSLLRIFIANRFIQRKGYTDVETALKYLKSVDLLKFFRFDIAGNGPDFDCYKKIFERSYPQVNLQGWIETEKYRKLMLECDVFVHASSFEPYGIPVVDACNCEKRVISSSGVCAAIDAKEARYPVQLFSSGAGLELGALLESAFKDRHSIYIRSKSHDGRAVFAPFRNLETIEEVLALGQW
jgi:glycosyltransferase involved in cell wall biosynthesis